MEACGKKHEDIQKKRVKEFVKYISSGVNAAIASPQRRSSTSATTPTSQGMEMPPALPKHARMPNLPMEVSEHETRWKTSEGRQRTLLRHHQEIRLR